MTRAPEPCQRPRSTAREDVFLRLLDGGPVSLDLAAALLSGAGGMDGGRALRPGGAGQGGVGVAALKAGHGRKLLGLGKVGAELLHQRVGALLGGEGVGVALLGGGHSITRRTDTRPAAEVTVIVCSVRRPAGAA